MSAADDKRRSLIDRLTDHVLDHGLAGASLRPLARAAGTSDRMLLYYFADKAALIEALLGNVAARLTAELETLAARPPLPAGVLARELPALATAEPLWRYMKLWLEVAALAARGDTTCATVGGAIGRDFVAWIEARIAGDPARRASEAALLLQLIDGALVLKSAGLDDVLALTARSTP